MTHKTFLIAVFTMLLSASTSAATYTYNWNGTCPLGCATNTATGQLVLNDNFDPSNGRINSDNFVSFSAGSSGDFLIEFTSPFNVFGNIDRQTLFVVSNGDQQAATGLFFQFGLGSNPWVGIAVGSGFGGSGEFALANVTDDIAVVPLPATLPLFAVALGGLGLISRLRARV